MNVIPLSGLVSEIFSSEVADRQNDRMTDRQTRKVKMRVAKAERSRTNDSTQTEDRELGDASSYVLYIHEEDRIGIMTD